MKYNGDSICCIGYQNSSIKTLLSFCGYMRLKLLKSSDKTKIYSKLGQQKDRYLSTISPMTLFHQYIGQTSKYCSEMFSLLE